MCELVLALAQLNTAVGDIEGNAEKILDWIGLAEAAGADVVLFPELSLLGYPPEDLLLKREFLVAGNEAMRKIAREVGDIVAVVGFAESGGDVFNAAAVAHRGSIVCTYRKAFLPNYGVFDERRYFGAGTGSVVLEVRGVRLGITICEDIWFPGGPMEEQVAAGAELVCNLSASPFNRGKHEYRERLAASRSMEGPVVLAYVNLVGAQDELVFDGGSFVYHPARGFLARAERFAEELLVCGVEFTDVRAERLMEPRFRYSRAGSRPGDVPVYSLDAGPRDVHPLVESPSGTRDHGPAGELFEALVLGLREYVGKNGFEKVVLGLSGGIDSALAASLAVEAIGAAKVVCAFMPSRFTSEESSVAAHSLAGNLGVELMSMPIDGVLRAYSDALAGLEEQAIEGTAFQNVQARIRGNMLMALSNCFGWLVLATGNKSELSMGYCTLYGDMAGGFALIKDLLKTQVYELAEYVNSRSGREVIPRSIIGRAPTAELAEGQLDTDTLPPYELLDPVLEAYVEKGLGARDIIERGFDRELVTGIISTVDANEYKRRQAPIGVKLTARAFGRDYRMPISITGRPRHRA